MIYYDKNDINYNREFYKKTIYTDYISYNTAINLLHTFDYAKFMGRPLNTLITINFYHDDKGTKYFMGIKNKLLRWMKDERKRKGCKPQDHYWAFAFEKPHDNVHVHFACHVEDELRQEFKLKIEKLVEKYASKKKENQLDLQEIIVLTDKIVANYMVKGVHPVTAKKLHIEKICRDQGRIFGQRARSSMKLSKTARKRAGFDASTDRHLWIVIHPHLFKGLCLARWDVNKVIPNAASTAAFDEMLENLTKKYQKPLASDLNVETTELGRRKKKTQSSATTAGLSRGVGFKSRNGRSGAAGRRNYAVPALPVGKHFQNSCVA